jgi:alkylation response protein AidB-like acyl-CoA dehydrogenase
VSLLVPGGLTTGQQEFRRELRKFLGQQRVRKAVAEIARRPPGAEPGQLEVYRWLGERGWLAPAWPVRYGGLGLGAVESALVTEELVLAGVPDDLYVLSIGIVGMLLLQAGTAEQKGKHLPLLASGDRFASVLFTEPECGSDLAALGTKAVRVPEGWRLRGEKTYNQKSQFADIALCAARTSPGPVAQHGITLFLLPLRSPGVHIEPVPGMANERFNLVVIDSLLLTEADVVGEVDDGWRLMNEMLELERTGIDFHAKARRLLDLVIRRAAATGKLAENAYAGPLADLDARLAAGHALAWEQVRNLDAGRPDAVSSAMAKWCASEQVRHILRMASEVCGLDAVLSAWDDDAIEDGQLEAAYRSGPGHRLASGTSEIMLYLIANDMGLL